MFKRIFRWSAVTAAAAGLAFGVVATPAFAAGTPVTANVDVTSSITLQMNTTAFTLTGLAGTTATQQNAVTEVVTTTDPAGYTLTNTPSGDLTSGAHTIPSSDLSVVVRITNLGMNRPSQAYTEAPNALLEDTETTATGVAGNTYQEDWSVAIPAAAFPGAYSMTMNYLATAS